MELGEGGYVEAVPRSIGSPTIEGNLARVFEISAKEDVSTRDAAARLAEERLAAGRAARA